MICRNCGALLGPDDSFCGSCGAPVLDAAPADGTNRSHGSSVPPAPPAPGFGATSTSTMLDPDDWDGTQASPAPPIAASGAGYTRMGNTTETDGPTRLDPVSTQVSPVAAPQVVRAVPVPSSAPASTSAQTQTSGSSVAASAGKGPSSRLFVALIIAIIVTVAVVVAGGAFVMYRLGQSSNVPTVQVAGSASSDKSTSTAQSSEDQQSSDSSSSDSSDASDASKGSNGESGTGQSTGGQSSGTSSKGQSGTGNSTQSENAGNGSGSDGSDGQSTSSAASNIYVNARFRYHVTVPDGYTWNREADNGDGRTFDGPQGVRIAAWGMHNVMSHTPQEELDSMKENLDNGSSITFENVAGPSVYLSYYTPEGNIVYRKEIVTDKTLCGVRITYPPTARSIGDSLAETVPPTLGFLD